MTNLSNPGNTPAPFGLPCPSWCTSDHAEQDRKNAEMVARVRQRTGQPDYTPDWMARWHSHTVAEVHNPEDPQQPVRVTLFRDDQLENPDPSRVVIGAEHADCMSPDAAMTVAAWIARAYTIATEATEGGESR